MRLKSFGPDDEKEEEKEKKSIFKKCCGFCCKENTKMKKLYTRAKSMFVRQESNIFKDSLASTKRNFKPWNRMTEEERKERVKYLWK